MILSRLTKCLLVMTLGIHLDTFASEIRIIENASYAIYNDDEPTRIVPELSLSTQSVLFFKFDGELICEKPIKNTLTPLSAMLDADASKPQPVRAVIRYDEGELHGRTVVWNGWDVFFYDKHGHRIVSFRCTNDFRDSQDHCTVSLGFRPDSINISITVWNTMREELFSLDFLQPNNVASDFPLDLSKIATIEVEKKSSRCNLF